MCRDSRRRNFRPQHCPRGRDAEVSKVTSSESRARAIRDKVEQWINKGKLQPFQIAVLSPFDKTKSCLSGINNLGKTALVSNPNEWRANKGVLFATIRSFKGLEADAIILTDLLNPTLLPFSQNRITMSLVHEPSIF